MGDFHLEMMREEQLLELPQYLNFKSSVTCVVQRMESNSDQEEGRGETAGWMMKKAKEVNYSSLPCLTAYCFNYLSW